MIFKVWSFQSPGSGEKFVRVQLGLFYICNLWCRSRKFDSLILLVLHLFPHQGYQTIAWTFWKSNFVFSILSYKSFVVVIYCRSCPRKDLFSRLRCLVCLKTYLFRSFLLLRVALFSVIEVTKFRLHLRSHRQLCFNLTHFSDRAFRSKSTWTKESLSQDT